MDPPARLSPGSVRRGSKRGRGGEVVEGNGVLAACQLSALSLLCIGYPGLSPAPRLQPAGPTVAAAPTRQFAILRTRSRDRWAPRSPEVSPVAPARAARTRTIGRVYKGTGGRKDHCRGSLEIHRSRPGLGERWIGVGAGAGAGGVERGTDRITRSREGARRRLACRLQNRTAIS